MHHGGGSQGAVLCAGARVVGLVWVWVGWGLGKRGVLLQGGARHGALAGRLQALPVRGGGVLIVGLQRPCVWSTAFLYHLSCLVPTHPLETSALEQHTRTPPQLRHLDRSYTGGLVQYIRNAKRLLRESKEGGCGGAGRDPG